jgi:hypothetical protein
VMKLASGPARRGISAHRGGNDAVTLLRQFLSCSDGQQPATLTGSGGRTHGTTSDINLGS